MGTHRGVKGDRVRPRLVIAAVLGTTFLGNAAQSSNSVSNVLLSSSPQVRCPPSSCRRSSRTDRNDHAEAERIAGRILGIGLLCARVVTIVGVLAVPGSPISSPVE
jgi:putative peptidoglycan lipid II flippase